MYIKDDDSRSIASFTSPALLSISSGFRRACKLQDSLI